MAMTICELPEDLVREIVSRVPLKDMRAVRLTCKKWDTLWKRGSFMCYEAARKDQMVALMNYTLHLINVVVDDVEHPTTEIIGKLRCQFKIIKVFDCEGLLLCVLRDSFRLVVWNPYLGQTKWIEPPSYSFLDKFDGCNRYRYSMGYDHNKKSHKILRFVDGNLYNLYRMETGHCFCYEMYDFDSNLWRTLDVGTPHWFIDFFRTSGAPLNGNTYWLATRRFTSNYIPDHLVCFDFTSERFGPLLPLPFSSELEYSGLVYVSCLQGGKLAVLMQFHRTMVTEIWVTDPTKVSWTKFLTVDTEPVRSMAFSPTGFFIDEEKKVAMVFDRLDGNRHTLNIIGEAGFFREVVVPLNRPRRVKNDYAPACSHYTPSLVQVSNTSM